jgi:hypothetical protein
MPTMNALSLVPHLRRCGYVDGLRAENYDFGGGHVTLATFSDTPHDSRSICTAAFDAAGDPAAAVAGLKTLGSPIVFSCYADKLQWWKQTTGNAELLENIASTHVRNFFDQHKDDFSPTHIFEGKTLRRLPHQKQLTFVDAGLMPLIERESGEAISALVERVIKAMEKSLGRHVKTNADVDAVYKSTFWLLAAKLLREKRVPSFITIKLEDIDDVFRRVGLHYGDTEGLPPGGPSWRNAIKEAARTINSFPRVAHVSVDALAHVYENAMIPPEVRKAHGIHSTPGALVDYMVWQLWPWIEQLPPERRHVFEPACGHAAFLVGALRVLRQWSDISDDQERHDCLRKHLHGIEHDSFALEVARLRLTLADMPHGNKWDLASGDMFTGTYLEKETKRCGVLLANPPYERFTLVEQSRYARQAAKVEASTKAAELLRRTIPYLEEGACFGVVIPRGLLHSNEGTRVRRKLLSDFEIAEVDVFQDKLFEKADHEAAVLLGRRKGVHRTQRKTWFRRVRNQDVEAFRDRFAFSSEEIIDVARFKLSATADLRVPELDTVWGHLSIYPKLGDVAMLGQGLFHKGEDLPRGTWTIHNPPQPGDPLGYANAHDTPTIFGTPEIVGINLSLLAVDRMVAGAPTGKPQVLLNYAPISRDAWRIKATLDEKGLAVTNRFVTVRPKTRNVSTLSLWALMNSPVANAFVSCHLGKRDLLVGTMRKLPVPHLDEQTNAFIEGAALRYRALATSPGPLYDAAATPEGLKQALLDMDAAVLRAYNLPPRLEHELLSFFWGLERKGVGCELRGYYRPDDRPFVPLHRFISDTFQRAKAGEIAKRYQPVRGKATLAAIEAMTALQEAD